MASANSKRKRTKKPIDARKVLLSVLNAEKQVQEEMLLQATAICFHKVAVKK